MKVVRWWGTVVRSRREAEGMSRRGAGQEKESLGEFFSHTPLVLIDGDPQLARIQGSVAALGARDVDEEAREEEEPPQRSRAPRSLPEEEETWAGEAHRSP